jgi:hypothetical protein
MTTSERKTSRLKSLNELMERLSAPDLTLNEAKAVNQQLRALLDAESTMPVKVETARSENSGPARKREFHALHTVAECALCGHFAGR